MKIIRRVQVKQIVTEKSKRQLQRRFEQDKMQLERECQQLLFEQRKLTNKLRNKQEVTARFSEEIERRKEQISLVNFKIEQLQLLELGSEIVEREVDAIFDVAVGMNWDELSRNQSIIVKDNKIERIDYE